ncbi:NAD(P)/FAD-dependent oxidoreductase [Candidatus Aquiluna sp. UB-MaderosW2red]|uniref:NAD(P)/FAD-dependent oxidoreductase n=1 Tax=Candidatus Aquiluna sp. UB-MaderosW2red TaxID=1855377 RepID=UPI000875E626|nr:FAD-dependent oxidoreductase [Candidatus Aquiluna sp. UB-MaderosW2red]SCX08803.1 NADH dehydrogenase [Candidatus Aquiluna sp. UB-MaderosW2red]
MTVATSQSRIPEAIKETIFNKKEPQRILIIGGGYAGFYAAWKLEKILRKGEAEVTLVDPLPYMTYQPFLPEVAAGSIEPRHVVVNHRSHLKKTNLLSGKMLKVNHKLRKATIEIDGGKSIVLKYDQVIMTAGAVTRTFPIKGIAEEAIGMKTIEEAVEVRNRLVGNFERAAALPMGPVRERLLTTVVVGGGFAGIETFAELHSAAVHLLRSFPEIKFEEVNFHLIEAMGRIMPEVSEKTALWVIKNIESRGAHIHLNTQLESADKGIVKLSTGESMESDLIIWTAGVAAAPVAKNCDFPLDNRMRIMANASLQIVDGDKVIQNAWTAGDVSAVPDLSGGGVGGFCVPNAQHAVRQAKLLAKNLVADIRGEAPKPYIHKNLGAVAGLGLYVGAFQSGKIGVTGFTAWVMHRGYHGLAMPTWERKIRVVSGWFWNWIFGRDLTSIEAVRSPRLFFSTWATRPAKK